MRRCGYFLGVMMVLVAFWAPAAEAPKEPAPTWEWPGPTPPEKREIMMKRTFVFRPTAQELKKMEEIAPDKPLAAPARPRKVLLFGRTWRHMANILTEETVKILGRKTGAFEVVTSDDPRMLLPDRLKEFDAIFFNGLHDPNPFLPPWGVKEMPQEQREAALALDKQVKESVLKFVGEDGKGIAAIEGALAALADWKEYGELMGAFYSGHYVGKFVIKAEDPSSPLTACLSGEPLRVFDQAYVPGAPFSRKKLRVLLSLDMIQTADPLADPKMAWLKPNVKKLEALTGRTNDYPISWIKSYGKGRVFYCSLGVQKDPYSNPLFMKYLLGGIQFAVGDLPADAAPSEK